MKAQVKLLHSSEEFRLVRLADTFVELSEHFKIEKHLLNKSPEELMKQFLNGLSVVAFSGLQIVGHLTLWPLLDDWYESGSIWVHPSARCEGLATTLKKELVRRSPHLNVLSTTTNSVVMRMNGTLGIPELNFWDLPLEIHRATCICSAEKMQAECFENCQLKNQQCRLFVRLRL